AAEEGLRASVWAAGARGPAFLVQAGGDLNQPFPGTDSAAPPRSTCNIRAAGGLVAALGFPAACCGVTLSPPVADYVYFENSSSNPYLIRRIEELNKTANGNVEAKVVCFYRRRDISSTLIALADKHATLSVCYKTGPGADNGEEGELEEEMENPEMVDLPEKLKHQLRHRELFLSRQLESLPATHIRGKCSVTLLNETESLKSYLEREVRPAAGSPGPGLQPWRMGRGTAWRGVTGTRTFVSRSRVGRAAGRASVSVKPETSALAGAWGRGAFLHHRQEWGPRVFVGCYSPIPLRPGCGPRKCLQT
ncbi:uncharacterized protein LOC132008765, partial [Mustela nigripes]|uniref:uncharacterized protein LOC132008765 n=1 Tax=Mustela nigripes TaxID=77151 RepID=UPI002815ADC7